MISILVHNANTLYCVLVVGCGVTFVEQFTDAFRGSVHFHAAAKDSFRNLRLPGSIKSITRQKTENIVFLSLSVFSLTVSVFHFRLHTVVVVGGSGTDRLASCSVAPLGKTWRSGGCCPATHHHAALPSSCQPWSWRRSPALRLPDALPSFPHQDQSSACCQWTEVNPVSLCRTSPPNTTQHSIMTTVV